MKAFALRFPLLLAALFIWTARPAAGQPSRAAEAAVSEVRYFGLVHITSRDLEAVLPFLPGDEWHQGSAIPTQKAITEYYAKRGFYHATVNVEANPVGRDQVVVTIRVDEGRPTLIKSIWIDDPPRDNEFRSKHVLERFKDRMSSILEVKAGDRYDEQLLSDRLRILREWLVGEDFILANTDTVRLNFNKELTEVSVVAAVDYGDRVTFGYQGNTVFTKNELNEFIDEIRATGLSKDYVGLIQRKFIEEYRNRSYNNASIEIKVRDRSNAKHVTFVIDEGVRQRFDEIKWEGLSEKNAEVARNVFKESVSRPVQRGYFIERDIDKGVLLVLEDLKSRGYLSSKLVAKSVQSLKTKAKDHTLVHVSVQIAEGEQTLVGTISLKGFSHLSKEQVLATLGLRENEAFNPFRLEEGIQSLRDIYLGAGFLEYHVQSKDDEIVAFSDNERYANVHLSVSEGTRIKVDTIEILGLQKTRRYVVEREVTVEPEDWWLAAKIQPTEANLRRLGLFSEVKIRAVASPKGPEYRRMIIEVQEAEPGSFEAGPGFRSDLGLRAFGRLSYNNIAGKNWIGTLSAESNRRISNQYRFIEYKLDAGFVEPRFFGTKNLYSLGISTKKQRFPPDFNASTTQFTTGFERKVFDTVTTRLFYKLERVRQFDVFINGLYSEADNQTLRIGSLVPSITWDGRDSPFTTTKGHLLNLSLEYANPAFAGQNQEDQSATGYTRWSGSGHYYIPITKNIVWSNVMAGGFERSNITGRPIPLIKLFRMGGYSNIRGFAEDSINVDAIAIKGTLTFLNLRTQFDLPLVGDLKFAPFLDAGNLYVDELKASPFFRAGAGAGLHYLTPIGPINLDYGVKLNRKSDESPSQIHFSVGFI